MRGKMAKDGSKKSKEQGVEEQGAKQYLKYWWEQGKKIREQQKIIQGATRKNSGNQEMRA